MYDDYEELDSFTAGIIRRAKMRQQVLDNYDGRSDSVPQKRLEQLAKDYSQLGKENTDYVPSHRITTETVLQKNTTKMAYKSYDTSDYELKALLVKTLPLKNSTNNVSQLSTDSESRKPQLNSIVNANVKVAPKVALLQKRLFGTPPATTCSTLVAKQIQSRKKEIAVIKEQFAKETNQHVDYGKELENRKEIEMIKNRQTPKRQSSDNGMHFQRNVVNVENIDPRVLSCGASRGISSGASCGISSGASHGISSGDRSIEKLSERHRIDGLKNAKSVSPRRVLCMRLGCGLIHQQGQCPNRGISIRRNPPKNLY